MAPGVRILTTDISGRARLQPQGTTPTFNGTSSATPFVAAACALVLSVRPDLERGAGAPGHHRHRRPHRPREREWTKFVGHGRLNAFEALRAARRL